MLLLTLGIISDQTNNSDNGASSVTNICSAENDNNVFLSAKCVMAPFAMTSLNQAVSNNPNPSTSLSSSTSSCFRGSTDFSSNDESYTNKPTSISDQFSINSLTDSGVIDSTSTDSSNMQSVSSVFTGTSHNGPDSLTTNNALTTQSEAKGNVVSGDPSTDSEVSEASVSPQNSGFSGLNISHVPHNNGSNDSSDCCHFLSFEEWKKKKVEKSPYKNESRLLLQEESTLSKSNINNIGENRSSEVVEHPEEDQGTIYKNRFNFASVDCAATIVKTDSNAKGASAILAENKNSYLLNRCSSPQKFVVIELCQDILIDTVVMGNLEFFSSNFRKVRFSVSDRFPVSSPTGWKVLGEFEAENVRDVQSFKINDSLMWAKYLKLEMLSHYGDEFYCPISIVRVHGKTMMEEFKMTEEQESLANGIHTRQDVDDAYELSNLSNFSSLAMEGYECKISLPYIGINEFLEGMNGTNDVCDASFSFPAEHETNSDAIQKSNTKTSQESIYKNIMKRLSLLESNATLSLLYIEEQSKLLSEAFSNLERRQTSSFEALVDTYNSSLSNNLLHYKNFFLEAQNEITKFLTIQDYKHQKSLKDANEQVTSLSGQLTFQRRLVILNTVIILCILVYVALTRDIYIEDLASSTKKSHSTGNYYFSVGSLKKRKYDVHYQEKKLRGIFPSSRNKYVQS